MCFPLLVKVWRAFDCWAAPVTLNGYPLLGGAEVGFFQAGFHIQKDISRLPVAVVQLNLLRTANSVTWGVMEWGDLNSWQWLIGCFGALLVGLGKGGVPGIGYLASGIYALTFPARESVGLLLPVLMCADVVAVTIYRRHAEWKYLLRLFPWTGAGVIVGYFAMDHIDDQGVRHLIGTIFLAMMVIHFFRKWQLRRLVENAPDPLPHSLAFVAFLGLLGGFVTMVANAAGTVLALYLLAVGLPKMKFIGTGAWFYLIVNCYKIPFQAGLGILTTNSLALSLTFGIFAVGGALIGPIIVRWINQRLFEFLVWIFVAMAALKLLEIV